MVFSNKAIATFLALIVSSFTTVLCYFLPDIKTSYLVVTAVSSFFICYIASYILLEIVIYKEFKNLYKSIIKLEDINSNQLIESIETLDVKKISSNLYRYSEKRNKELIKMKEVEAFRRQFLADIAHELKTPIHIAQGFIETLIDGAIDDLEVRDRFLNKTNKALENLDFIIRDLINISHLETGEIQLDFQETDLVLLVEKIITQLEQKAESKGKTIHFEHDTPKVKVEIDDFRMNQVFTNLIGNAINYSGTNQNIWIKTHNHDDYFDIEIIDDGIGIGEEHHDKLFNRFYRVDKSRSKDQGGTGLGLAIAKHIIEAHQSELKLKSSVGKGAQFYFRLYKKVID